MKKYADFLFRFKWLNLLIVALVILSSMGGLELLKTNYHVRYWLDSEDQLIKTLDYFEDNFGNDETVVISLFSEMGILTPKVFDTLKALDHEITQIKDVKSTQSLINLEVPYFNDSTGKLSSHKIVEEDFQLQTIIHRIQSTQLIEKFFISADHKMTLMIVHLNPTIINSGEVFQEIDYRNLTQKLREIVAKYKTDDFRIDLSGTAILQNDFSAISEKDLALIMPVLFLFICIVLYRLFRSFILVIISVIVISLTNTFVYGVAGHLGFAIENMSSIVPIIVLTISLADMIHIFVSYREFRILGQNQIEAIKSSLINNFIPTLLTSVTTGIGFSSLAGSRLVPVSNMGIMAAVGVTMAWILSISLFPILFAFIKDKNDYVTLSQKKIFSDSFQKFIQSKTTLIILFFTLGATIFGVIGAQNQVNTHPLKFFKKGTEVRDSADFILDTFGAVTGPEVIIHSGYREGILEPEFLNKVDKFGQWLKEHKYISKTISIVELGKELHQKIKGNDSNFYAIPATKDEIVELYFDHKDDLKNTMKLESRISSDMESMRLSLLWSISETRQSLDRLEVIKSKAKELGLTIRITGKSTLYLSMNDYVVDTFFISMGYSVLAISLLMLILFKSFKFMIISMLPNLVPLGFITGVMSLSDIYIDMGTALVCSVCLGIAIDDTIHFLIQYYREKQNHATDESYMKVLNKIGRALFVTSFILVIGFGFFMLSDFIPNIKFGFLCSLTISVALMTDYVLLPAVLHKFDRN